MGDTVDQRNVVFQESNIPGRPKHIRDGRVVRIIFEFLSRYAEESYIIYFIQLFVRDAIQGKITE